MNTGLIESSANGLLPVISDSSLPVFEAVQDINLYITQSGSTKPDKTGIKPLSLLSYVWRVIRELSGDDAYERYIAQHTIDHPNVRPLARKDFFLRQQQKKWSGIQRCC